MSGGFDQTVNSASQAGFQTSPGGQFIIQPCGLQQPNPSYHPCEPVKLGLSVAGGGSAVSCTTPAFDDGSLTLKQTELLRGDDLLLQVLSDATPEARGGSTKSIAIDAQTAPACVHNTHAKVTFSRLSGPTTPPVVWTMATPAPQEVLSPAATFKSTFFERYWPFGRDGSHTYKVVLGSCGIPADETKPCKDSFTGRIEVFRKCEYALKFSVPPLAEGKLNIKSEKSLKTLETEMEISGSGAVGFGALKGSGKATLKTDEGGGLTGGGLSGAVSTRNRGFSASVDAERGENGQAPTLSFKTTRSGDGVHVTYAEKFSDPRKPEITMSETRDDVLSRSTVTVTQKHGLEEEVEIEKETHFDKVEAFSLTYNGDNVEVVQFLGAVLNLPKTITAFCNDLKDAVPKVGWTYDLAVGVLEGSVTGTWKLADNPAKTHDRIWEVGRHYALTFECSLITISFSFGIGVEWKLSNPMSSTPLVELVVKAAVSLSFKVDVAFTVDSSAADTFDVGPMKGTCVPDFTVTAQAKLSGMGAEATVKIESGFEAEFTFEGGFTGAPKMPGQLNFLPMKISFTYQWGYTPQTIELMQYPQNKVNIWTGDLMAGTPSTPPPAQTASSGGPI